MGAPWSRLSAGFRAGVLDTCAICLLAGTLVAQQAFAPDELRARSGPYVPPPPPNTLRTQVNLVEVPVVVRDGKHRAVAGLKQTDFQIFDAGKKQEITAFSMETLAHTAETKMPDDKTPAASPTSQAKVEPPPRFIVLCFDNLSTGFADLKLTKAAAERFVKTGIAPGDRVAVLTTASSQNATFTGEPSKLIESIEKVTPQQRTSDDMSSCPRITGYQAYVIVNRIDNDTLEGVAAEDMACKRLSHARAVEDVISMSQVIWENSKMNSQNVLYSIGSIVEGLGKLPGRRMLLLASAGFLTGNLESDLDALTTKAVHAEVVINSLDAKGLYALTPGRPIEAPPVRGRSTRTQIAEVSIQSRQAQAKDDGLVVLATGTGGAFYHNSNDLDKGFHELSALPDVVYVLGFSPTDATPDGRYHSLKVKLAAGHYSVQARLGYTAPTKTPPVAQRQPTRMDTEVMASDTLAEVPVSIASEPGQPENGAPTLSVVVHLDVGRLKFVDRAERHLQKLGFLVALLDAGGSFVAGRQAELELALTKATYDKLIEPGFNVTLPLQAPPGTYTLRGLIQDFEGKMTASSLQVEVK